MIEELLKRFEPDGDVLLRAISAHVTDEMLELIAGADYGDRREEYFAALLQVRQAGSFPDDLARVPMEVLELIRWSEPEDPNWKPGRTGEFGHWMRAFSCAAVLRAEHEPWNYKYNDGCTDSTTIQLILSLEALPVQFHREAARSFAWLLLRSDPEGKGKWKNESVREYGVALLWFALHMDPRVTDDDLISLAQWTVKRAEELAEFDGLRGLVIGCMQRSEWEMLGVKLAELGLGGGSQELQTWVRLIAEQLVD